MTPPSNGIQGGISMRETDALPPEFDDDPRVGSPLHSVAGTAEVPGRGQGPGSVPALPGRSDRGIARAADPGERPLPQRLPVQGAGHVLQPARDQAPGPGREDRRGLPGSLCDDPRARARLTCQAPSELRIRSSPNPSQAQLQDDPEGRGRLAHVDLRGARTAGSRTGSASPRSGSRPRLHQKRISSWNE